MPIGHLVEHQVIVIAVEDAPHLLVEDAKNLKTVVDALQLAAVALSAKGRRERYGPLG
jgi:hypothetical protein